MSIKNEMLKQTGLISRSEYLAESSETDAKFKKMEIESQINNMFKDLINNIRSLKYNFEPRFPYPGEQMDATKAAYVLKKTEDMKEEFYKKINGKLEDVKLFIDDVFGKKDEPEVKDDDYEGEEDEE